jgi:D-alanyl-D-alanine dipeptidase
MKWGASMKSHLSGDDGSWLFEAIEGRELPLPGWERLINFDFNHELSKDVLVDVSAYGIAVERYYSRTDGWNWPYGGSIFPESRVRVRSSVAEMLQHANASLAQIGLRLILLDGLRTLAEQECLWKFFYSEALRRSPGSNAEELAYSTRRFCYDPTRFDPGSPLTWPVHMTGGSVDATVGRTDSRESLFMGSLFDDPSEISHTSHFESETGPNGRSWTQSERFAARARRCLHHAMEDAGFTSYAAEWWHFDYGTSLWAVAQSQRGKPMPAFYSAIDQR